MIVRRGRTKMGLLWSPVIYCSLFLFLIYLPNVRTSESVIRKCVNKYTGPSCSKADQLLTDCIVNSIKDSRDLLDVRTKLTTKINRIKNTKAYFCAEWPKVQKEAKVCDKKQTLCSSQRTEAVDLCGRNTERCYYFKYAACRIKAGMLQARSIHQLRSELCLETDLTRGLVPYYGPHLKCYEKIMKYPKHINFPLDHYLQFCHQFDYNQLKNCIEAKLEPLSSAELLSDKNKYIGTAEDFLLRTNNFCKALLKIDNSFLTNCRMKTVLNCTSDAFDLSKVNSNHHHSGYIPCISQRYTKCHAPIGDIVERFLTGKPISGFTIISPSYLVLFLVLIFSTTIRS